MTCQLFCTIHDVSSVNGKKLAVAGNALYRVVSADKWLFLHAQLSQLSLLHNVVCFVSHLLLALFGHGECQRCRIGCSCFGDDCFCMFLVCFKRDTDSIVPTELSIQYLHLLRHSWFVTKYCSVTTRSTSKQDPLVLLTQRTRLRAEDISNFSGDDRTKRVKPYQL